MDIAQHWEGGLTNDIYFDPVDEPTPGNTILVTFAHDKRLKFYGPTVEDCLRSLLTTCGDKHTEILFRRVPEDDVDVEVHAWDLAVPVGTVRNRASARQGGCWVVIGESGLPDGR